MSALMKAEQSDLQKVESAIAGMDKVRAGLANLQAQYGGVIFEVTTTDGMKAAKAARAAIREPRYEVERIRKEAKAPILAIGRQLDATAAAITCEIEKIEKPIVEQIANEEARIERERQAAIRAEAERVAKHRGVIEDWRRLPVAMAGKPSHEVKFALDGLEEEPVSALRFEEFLDAAATAKAEGLRSLNEIYQQALKHEAEREELRRQRAEVERLRAEAAERERIEREAREAEDRARREAHEREQAAAREELRREREELEQRRRDQELREAKEREAAQAKEAAAAARKKAKQRPSREALIELIANAYQVPKIKAESWLIEEFSKEAAC